MKKFNMAELKPVSTLMSSATSLGSDEDGKAVDQREYGSLMDSLLYLTVTRQFSGYLGISNTHSGFDILLLRWIMSAFRMLILWVVGLIIKALLGFVIFLDLLSFVGLLKNNLQLSNPP
jgi:hypothetical protein